MKKIPQSYNDTCSLSLGTASKNKDMFYSSWVTQFIAYNLQKFARSPAARKFSALFLFCFLKFSLKIKTP